MTTDCSPVQSLLVKRESRALWSRRLRIWRPNYQILDLQSDRPLLFIHKCFGRPYQIFDAIQNRQVCILKHKFSLFKYQYLLHNMDQNLIGRIEAPIWLWGYHIRLITSTGQRFNYRNNDPEGRLTDENGCLVMKLNFYPPGSELNIKDRADLTWTEWYLIELLKSDRTHANSAAFSSVELLAIASLPLRWKWHFK